MDADSIRDELKAIVNNRVPPRIVSSCVTMEICDNPPNGCLPFECSYSLVSFYGSSGDDLENFKEGSSYRIFNLQVSKGSHKYRIKFKSQKNTKYYLIPTNTEERYILPRNFCRASELKRSDINHTIDFVGIILSVLSQSSGEQYIYHLLCCDESMEKVIIKVSSLKEKDSFFKPWEPMIFVNLQRMYACKRYHKLNASIYSEFQKAPKPPFQKTRRLNELSAFMKQHKELLLSKDDYAELLKEVSLGCPEQILGDQHESQCACSIMPFESMITVGNVHFFGNRDEAHLFTSETGFIFNVQIKDSTEYVSFGESQIKDLLKVLIPPTQLTDICTKFQQTEDDDNYISKRDRVFQLAELSEEMDKLIFMLHNGKISTSIEKATLFPFSQREWSSFISDLSIGISNKLFSAQTQEVETSRCLYATKIHPL